VNATRKEPHVKLTIIGPNLADQSKGAFHVHATGCADLNRGQYRNLHRGDTGTYVEDHDSIRSVVDSVYGPEAGGFYEENDLDPETAWREYEHDFYFAPCCWDALPAE
jgi:hypothetical protein